MNDLEAVTADDPQIVTITNQARELMRQVEEVTIDSNDMYELADISLGELHGAEKALEAATAKFVKPAADELKRRRALLASPTEWIEIAKRTLRRKMAAWQDKLRVERERAEREAEAAMRKEREAAQSAITVAEEVFAAAPSDDTSAALEDAHAAAEIADITILAPRTVLAPSGSAGKGEEWVVEQKPGAKELAALLRFIADDLEKDVPRFDNTVDIKISQLKAYAKATKGTKEIPGCTIRRTTRIISR